ncbi:MAG: hypothetical protein AMXMBFR82_50820 [Candidatus Hydrogenedentota bacterium]
MNQETYREMVLTSPKHTWTEAQTVRALVLAYARWNWGFLVMSYFNVAFMALLSGPVRNPSPWIGILGMTSIGVAMMMHDLTTNRRLATVLGLGVPSRTVARAMWYEAVVLPALAFFILAIFPAALWGLGLPDNTFLPRLFANGVNALVVAAFCSVMVHAAKLLGPPASRSWREFLLHGSGPSFYMVIIVIAAVAFGYVCYFNFDVLVRNEIVRLPWYLAAMLFAAEGVVAVALVLSARTAAQQLLIRHVCAHKVGVTFSVPDRLPPPTHGSRRPAYWELVCREAVRQGALALSIPIVGAVLIAIFLDLRGYDPGQRELLVAMAGWLPILAVFWTVRRLAQWLASLAALRMLPWRADRIVAFMLATPIATGIVACAAVLVMAFGLGLPIHAGWALLLMWVPALGYLLFPRSGVGVLGGAFFLWGFVVTTGLGSGAAMPVYGVCALVIAIAMALQTRRLIRSDAIYRQRDFAFLGEERN